MPSAFAQLRNCRSRRGLYVWSTVLTLSPRARHELRKSRTSSSSGVGLPLRTVESRVPTARSYTLALLAAKNSKHLAGLRTMPVDRLECAVGPGVVFP